MLWFFFDYRKRTHARFPELFGSGNEESDGANWGLNPLSNYGWLHVLQGVTERDITKWDLVLAKPAWEVFTHMQYMKDYNAEQKRLFELSKHGH